MKRIDSSKVIPLIRQEGTRSVPTFLKTKLFIDFSKLDDFEFGFDELVRTLHNAPLYKKPEIGNNPFQSVENVQPEKTGDAILSIMRWIVDDFENGEDYSDYQELLDKIDISRIMLDVIIENAVKKELITQDRSGDLYLTKKGKFYAIEHKLIKA
jgi:hypothetical protein